MTGQVPAVVEQPTRRGAIQVFDAVPLYDTAKFEHMQRVATIMAKASIIPDQLKGKTGEETLGNCFLIVNQAFAWNMDPFAVAQCSAIVHGKPCYEGKLIAAVVETKLGLKLKYEWTGKEGDDEFKIRIWNPDEPEQWVEGTVGQWKTKQWGDDHRKRLKYRGDREWCRMWAPALMLGVYSDDEMQGLEDDARARRARPIPQGSGLADRLNAPGAEGFSPDHAERELADHNKGGTDVNTGTPADAESAGASADQTSQGDVSRSSVSGDSQRSNGDAFTETAAGAERPDEAGEKPANNSNADDASPPSTSQAESSQAGSTTGGDAPSRDERPADGAATSFVGEVSEELAKGLTEYSNALQRVTQQKSLKKISDDFRNRNGWTTDQKNEPRLKWIYECHQKRIKQDLAPGAIEADLRKAGVR